MILVTGATGCVGRNLIRELVKSRYEVICQVRRTSNIKTLKELGVKFFYADIRDHEAFKDVFQKQSIHAVIHPPEPKIPRSIPQRPHLLKQTELHTQWAMPKTSIAHATTFI